jgi:hypothetical protein
MAEDTVYVETFSARSSLVSGNFAGNWRLNFGAQFTETYRALGSAIFVAP